MPRFFIDSSAVSGDILYITGKDAEHVKVLRMKPGEPVVLCDGKGMDFLGKIESIRPNEVGVQIEEKRPSPGEPDVFCTVYAAFPKSDKAEAIVQKSVEIGAGKVVFFRSKRCVSVPDERSLCRKLDRWQKIAEEAAKQCGRGVIPQVEALASFELAVRQAAQANLPLLFYEGAAGQSVKTAFEGSGKIKTASVMTGPEGGFEPQEVQTAEQSGMKTAGLGSRILRCETAPICALTAVMLYTGNM